MNREGRPTLGRGRGHRSVLPYEDLERCEHSGFYSEEIGTGSRAERNPL